MNSVNYEKPGQPKRTRLSVTASELLQEHNGNLPVYIRSPKSGNEFYTGLSRSKLYELASAGKIRSASLREPGRTKGTRLFLLASVLAFIESCEVGAMAGGAAAPTGTQPEQSLKNKI